MNYFLTLLWLIMLSTVLAQAAPKANTFQTLCYHNVVDTITDPDIMNITTDQLISHFKWLKENGYTVISIDDIINAKEGRKPLPPQSVLLTFDDGYSSFYTRIYPLLKLYNYPAVYGLVGKWQETPLDKSFTYGKVTKSRNILLTWDEVKEMMDSGLVEIASHSYNGHYGALSNPQGNTRPFYTTLQYDTATQQYESEAAYIQRVEEDIKRSSDVIFEHTGVRPRMMLWPFGAYNYIVQELANKYGMHITATLDNGANTPDDLPAIKRMLISNNIDFNTFFWSLKPYVPDPQRALYVDPDDIYDTNATKMEKNLGLLIEAIRKYGASTVIVKAFADTDNDGIADMLYFPNKELPMRADILGRMLWQIKGRANVTFVHAWMPLSAFQVSGKLLSLHHVDDKKRIKNIYYAMAKHTFLQGILFDNTYPNNYRADTIVNFTKELQESIKYFTRRYHSSLLLPSSASLLQRNHLTALLDTFDSITVNMPPITNAHPKALNSLVASLLHSHPDALKHTTFKFNAYDSTHANIAASMLQLTLKGALNFGYEAEHYIDNHTVPQEIYEVFSSQSNPFEP